ncbi:MAG: FkbM family methyltransferase [Rhizobiaceae bacterium]
MTKQTGPELDDQYLTSPFGRFSPSLSARIAWKLATARWLSHAKRKWFRKRLARRFPGPFDVMAEGLKVRAWPSENRCDRIAVGRSRLPEAEERRLLKPFLTPGMVFVDIGANVGVYSLYVSQQTGGNATVLAFEPHPRTFSKFKTNCALNGFDKVRPHNFGVGAENTEAELYSDGGGNIGGSSMLREAGGGAAMTPVQVKRLTGVLEGEGIEQVDLLKIDIEGFEDRALMPLFRSENTEHLWPRVVLLETVHQPLWQTDLLAELKALGYVIAGKTEENILFQRS